ncbi:hypothetical protein [Methyloradius palustris]|uniref:Uncharacterized protein n=1 Tax=Methyloradius palustris TaxID=2778876 RepID=A0A8D5G784_9PROT|nr:hypothetical protein [Methyloradius palustris]BCM24516.1 hypothetical protein ZMTM_07750 [Methyloradius palustris]
MQKTIRSIIFATLFTLPPALHAVEMASDEPVAKVNLVESEDERCVANDGKMISLQADKLTQTLVVWVDGLIGGLWV